MVELGVCPQINLPVLANTEVRRMVDRAIDTSAETAVDIPVVTTRNQSSVAGVGRRCHRLTGGDVVALGEGQRMSRADHFELGERKPIVVVEAFQSHESTERASGGPTCGGGTRVGRSPGAHTKVVRMIVLTKCYVARMTCAVILINCKAHWAEDALVGVGTAENLHTIDICAGA